MNSIRHALVWSIRVDCLRRYYFWRRNMVMNCRNVIVHISHINGIFMAYMISSIIKVFMCINWLCEIWCLIVVRSYWSLTAFNFSTKSFIQRMCRIFLILYVVFMLRVKILIWSYKHRLFYKGSISLSIFVWCVILCQISDLPVCSI